MCISMSFFLSPLKRLIHEEPTRDLLIDRSFYQSVFVLGEKSQEQSDEVERAGLSLTRNRQRFACCNINSCEGKWSFISLPTYTLFFYKNHAYKNVEAQITLKIKNIVVILLVAISFPASVEVYTFL